MSPGVRRIAFAFLFVTLLPDALAATTAQIEDARAKGLKWLLTHQNGDGRWNSGGGLEVQSTAAAVEAMANAGIKKGASYGTAVAWLKNADATSTDSLSRKIAALAVVGLNEKADLDLLLSWTNSSTAATWGAFSQFSTGFPDTPLALSAIRLGQYAYTNQSSGLLNAVYCNILPAQRPDYSWAYTKPVATAPALTSTGAILPSAYTLIELQAIKTANPTWGSNTCGATYNLSTAISNGVTWLLTKKNLVDNGFGDIAGQSGVLETVLAYQVLNAVNSADPARGTALDYLIAQQDVAGSWQNSPFITALVLKALPPTILPDSNNDGIPDAVAALMGNPSARSLVNGNGQSVIGLTVPLVLASQAYLNQPFSFTLTATGGTAPYAWAVSTGSLPSGLSLSSGGVISGTPANVGNFSFTYTAMDATGASSTTVGQIDVLRAPPAPADGDLNGDGLVNAADVALAERFALGLAVPTAAQMEHADVAPAGNPDGVIDAADVARIRRKALGLETF